METVEREVVLDQPLHARRVVDRFDHLSEAVQILGDHLGCRKTDGQRFEHPAHFKDFQHGIVVVQVDDERHGLEEKSRFEAGHISTVAAADIEDPDHLEGLDRLAQRIPRQAEPLAQLLLGGQSVAGT